jgi:nitroreductase
MKRRSIRNFTDRDIPADIVGKLLDAAANAPSGGNIQPLSIILVEEAERRNALAKIVGEQPWVRKAPLSMIFCIDFHRVKRWAAINRTEFKGEKALAHFLIAFADVMCAAQTVSLLAEEFGLGSVYIGTIQSNIDRAREVFALPQYVLPMMVLSLGYPASVPRSIPKLERGVIVHRERYSEQTDEEIARAFDAKYGNFSVKAEEYLEKAFIEAVEAEKLGAKGFVAQVEKEMQKLEIKNNAEFLFKLRYPTDVMVTYNREMIESMKRSGFDFLSC